MININLMWPHSYFNAKITWVSDEIIMPCTYIGMHIKQGWKWVGWPRQSGSFESLFSGSSGSHPQIKLSGCDPDITCSLKTVLASGKWVNLGLMNALKYHWCETSLLLSQVVLKHVVSKDFIFRKSLQGTGIVLH